MAQTTESVQQDNGINPTGKTDAQLELTRWRRRQTLQCTGNRIQNDTRDHGVLVVHGHTPVKKVQHRGNRIDIDTGAAHGGPVSGVRLDDDGVWLLTDRGPERVEPPKHA